MSYYINGTNLPRIPITALITKYFDNEYERIEEEIKELEPKLTDPPRIFRLK
jgi:hypothetical protein